MRRACGWLSAARGEASILTQGCLNLSWLRAPTRPPLFGLNHDPITLAKRPAARSADSPLCSIASLVHSQACNMLAIMMIRKYCFVHVGGRRTQERVCYPLTSRRGHPCRHLLLVSISTCVTLAAPRPSQICMFKEASCALCPLLESGTACSWPYLAAPGRSCLPCNTKNSNSLDLVPQGLAVDQLGVTSTYTDT